MTKPLHVLHRNRQTVRCHCKIQENTYRPISKARHYKEISDKFAQYTSKHDILYVPPNFVIYLNCPPVQKDMLSEPTIRTQNFELDVLPWSREHELAQLPWIIGIALTSNILLLPSIVTNHILHHFHTMFTIFI